MEVQKKICNSGNVIYAYDGIPSSNEKEETKVICNSMSKFHIVLNKISPVKERTLYDFIYIKVKKDRTKLWC